MLWFRQTHNTQKVWKHAQMSKLACFSSDIVCVCARVCMRARVCVYVCMKLSKQKLASPLACTNVCLM